MKDVKIYIATSLKSPKRLNGKVGYILETDTAKGPATYTRITPVQQLTANQSEMTALYKALWTIKEPSHLVIFTDSAYLKTSIERLQAWKRDGWKNSKGKDVANKEAWIVLEEKLSVHEVEMRLKENHSYKKWLDFEVTKKN